MSEKNQTYAHEYAGAASHVSRNPRTPVTASTASPARPMTNASTTSRRTDPEPGQPLHHVPPDRAPTQQRNTPAPAIRKKKSSPHAPTNATAPIVSLVSSFHHVPVVGGDGCRQW